MKNSEISLKKICGFYVNEWHLTTMTLPHINKQLKEKVKIITLLEEGIKDNIEQLLSKMNLDEKTKEQILQINWTSYKEESYMKIEKRILNSIKKQDKIEIIIKGNNEYINIMNKQIEKVIEGNSKKIKNKQINVINYYEVTQFSNINDILQMHDLILNTSGIRNIEDVFDGYKKVAL